jgi:hypothetical protein
MNRINADLTQRRRDAEGAKKIIKPQVTQIYPDFEQEETEATENEGRHELTRIATDFYRRTRIRLYSVSTRQEERSLTQRRQGQKI